MRTKERETISLQTIIVELVIIGNVITKVRHMKMCGLASNSRTVAHPTHPVLAHEYHLIPANLKK